MDTDNLGEMDELLVEVRASTAGFASDIAQMRGTFDATLVDGFRGTFDATLVDGFRGAGDVLERGLSNAIRKGSLGFEDLKRIGLSVIDQIASRALNSGLDQLFGSAGGGGVLGNLFGGGGAGLAGLFGGSSLSGLPGRATGGPVSPGRGYLVGERGPEVFVPTSAGRVETGAMGGSARDVRVSINLSNPRGENAPMALRRSNRQLASAVRRALL